MDAQNSIITTVSTYDDLQNVSRKTYRLNPDSLLYMVDSCHMVEDKVSMQFYMSPLSYTIFCDFQIDLHS